MGFSFPAADRVKRAKACSAESHTITALQVAASRSKDQSKTRRALTGGPVSIKANFFAPGEVALSCRIVRSGIDDVLAVGIGAIVSSFIVLAQTMQDTRNIRGLWSSFMERATATGTVRSGLATKPPSCPTASSRDSR